MAMVDSRPSFAGTLPCPRPARKSESGRPPPDAAAARPPDAPSVAAVDLFRTKSVGAHRCRRRRARRDRTRGVGRLRKHLSARHLVGFGIGVVIGTGIFTLTGVEARDTAGPAVVISFAIAGVVALLAALCYAELASSVPTAGSAYSYAYATVGELVAWIIGWDLFLEFALGAAVVARGWSGYVGNLLDLPTSLFGEESTVNVGAALIVVVLTVVAALGIRESARVTSALVIVKVAICVFVIVAGAWYVRGANLTPFVPPSRASEGGEGLAQPLISAVAGLEPAVFGIGGRADRRRGRVLRLHRLRGGREPVRGDQAARPRPARSGLLGTLGLATALYIGVSFVLVGMVDYRDIDPGAPIADAFDQVGPRAGRRRWCPSPRSPGLTSVILVDLITMTRIGFAMGRDGLLPPVGGQGEPPHRHAGAHDAAVRRRGAGHGDLHPAGDARQPGQHRHPVRLPAGVGRRAGAAADAAGPARGPSACRCRPSCRSCRCWPACT